MPGSFSQVSWGHVLSMTSPTPHPSGPALTIPYTPLSSGCPEWSANCVRSMEVARLLPSPSIFPFCQPALVGDRPEASSGQSHVLWLSLIRYMLLYVVTQSLSIRGRFVSFHSAGGLDTRHHTVSKEGTWGRGTVPVCVLVEFWVQTRLEECVPSSQSSLPKAAVRKCF